MARGSFHDGNSCLEGDRRGSLLQEAHRLVKLDFALGQTPQHCCAPLPNLVASRVRHVQGRHDII